MKTLEDVCDALVHVFGNRETENNWARLDELLTAIQGTGSNVPACLWRIQAVLAQCILSERSKLSTSAMEALKRLYGMMMLLARDAFDPHYETFVPALLKLCERTNRVFTVRAHDCLQTIISPNAQSRFVVPFIAQDCMGSASKTLRQAAVKTLIMWIQRNGQVDDSSLVETILKRACEDAAGEVREMARELFAAYIDRWPQHRDRLAGLLSVKALKVLNISKPTSSHDNGTSNGSNTLKSFLAAQRKPSADLPTTASHAPGRISLLNSAVKETSTLSAKRVPIIQSQRTSHPKAPLRRPDFLARPEFPAPSAQHLNNSTAPENSLKESARRILPGHGNAHSGSLSMSRSTSQASSSSSLARSSLHSSSTSAGDLLHSSVWSDRFQAMQEVMLHPDVLTPKLWGSVVACLSDTHHRVVQSALDALNQLAKGVPPNLMEELMVRAATIVLNFKSKLHVLEQLAALRLSLRSARGSLGMINLLLTVQGRPDVQAKIRVVLISWLSEEIDAFGMELDPALTRQVATKMAVPVSDCLDEELARSAVRVFHSLHKVLPECLYWGTVVVPHVKSAIGRQRLNLPSPSTMHGDWIADKFTVSSPSVLEPAQKRTKPSTTSDSLNSDGTIFAPLDEEISIKLKIMN